MLKSLLRPLYRLLLRSYWSIIRALPQTRAIYYTRETQTPISVAMWFMQKVCGWNRHVYWPVHYTSTVVAWKNIYAGIETAPGYAPGCYIQGLGKIYVGDYTQIAANVGIISANHDPYDNRKHLVSNPVRIGRYGWIGMNAVILPGVELGDFTVVGAGSIVTRSFAEGYCVIAGNPARLIKKLDPTLCVEHRSTHEYFGYVPKARFDEFRKQYLYV